MLAAVVVVVMMVVSIVSANSTAAFHIQDDTNWVALILHETNSAKNFESIDNFYRKHNCANLDLLLLLKITIIITKYSEYAVR